MRTLAIELAPHSIRVNTVHPTGVNTPMVSTTTWRSSSRRSGGANIENLLPVELVEAVDISNAVLGSPPTRPATSPAPASRSTRVPAEVIPTASAERRDAIARDVVGRRRELDLVLAAVSAGRDILLEGPPGTSKSTMLRAITANWDVPFVLVEGNAELTPARMVGHHNPARVLREDYSSENFVPGPAGGGDGARAGSSTSRSSTGRRGHAQRAARRDGRARGHRAAGRHDHRARRRSGCWPR
jgi:hypothetical protein